MKQGDLFDPPAKSLPSDRPPTRSGDRRVAFDGETYDPKRDYARLSAQLRRVYNLMLDGNWHTLAEIAYRCAASQPAASARLRDLRKQQYGGHIIERQYLHDGLFQYRMIRTATVKDMT